VDSGAGARSPRSVIPESAATVLPRIPDYELIRIIDRGSYGDVWLARGVTGLFRAVKIVRRERFREARPYEREFAGLREFAAISHGGRQLALLHVGHGDGGNFFYYVMELADDATRGRHIDPANYVPRTLKATDRESGRLPVSEVLVLAVELTRALAELHAHGLVHRDIKPSNVIFVAGRPKLADIGLVTATTHADTFVGTEGFVAPEGPGTVRADLYSLGKLLYELATGLDRHEYPRLPANLDELPDRKVLLEMNEVLILACEPDPAKRYADADALLADLLRLEAGGSVRRRRRTQRSLLQACRIAAVLALAAAIATAGAYAERQRAAHDDIRRVPIAAMAPVIERVRPLEVEHRTPAWPAALANADRP
jgi:serine/threonine protein kinase